MNVAKRVTDEAQMTAQLNYMSRQANKLQRPKGANDVSFPANELQRLQGAKLRRSQMTPDAGGLMTIE